MKTLAVTSALLFLTSAAALRARPDPSWLGHDRERPLPPIVTPAVPSTQAEPGRAPSDATVLFDGTNLSAWVAMDGSATKWVVRDGALECVPGSGYVRTVHSFGDCQLHVEWAA
ncbi:MAG TPA: family 16 glycoside hydrolase, partial [Candidatus Synoicihabitans sp.]|nr:family 16 glycoside hydrolase [Candidatus Synoicihabitans sp.]